MDLINTTDREGTFDAGHRIISHKNKCSHIHGHTYLWKLKIMSSVNYSKGFRYDFGVIKEVFGGFIEEFLDHGFIANPKDTKTINFFSKEKYKLWVMSLNGADSCEPSAELIAKELLYVAKELFGVSKIILNETPKCSVSVSYLSASEEINLSRNLDLKSKISKYKHLLLVQG